MKYLITALILVCSYVSYGQYPVKQTLGSPSTIVQSKGGLASDSGFINAAYADTLAASNSRIAYYPGAQIRVGNNIWMRNTTGTEWIKIASDTGSDTTVSNRIDSILTQLDSLNIKVDSVTFGSSENVDTVKYYVNGTSYVVGYIDRPDGLISPGFVSWSGTGLTFDVTAAIYRVGGHRYTSAAGSITLNTADASLPRIDVIAVDTSGSIIKITGTPDANPVTPQVDVATQVYLTSIYVSAGATVPSGINTEIIYDENTEWATSTTSSNVDFNDATLPFHGSKDIKAVNSTALLDFTNTSLIKVADYSVIKLYVNTPASGQIVLKFYKNGRSVGIINVTSAYGFKNISGYQNITVPLSSVLFSGTSFNKVEISYTSPSASTAYFDYVQLQGGISNQGNSNAITSVFRKEGTDSVFYVSNGVNIYAFKDSTTNQPLLTYKSVPYVGTDGLLHEDNTGLYWDGYNLVAGGNGYNNTTGILLNGGRGSIQASGVGVTIKTVGSTPADTSKHISFYNSDRKYLDLNMDADSALNMVASVNIYPDTANTYNLGDSTKQWDTTFTKKLYLNGVEFNPVDGAGISEVIAGWGLGNTNDSTLYVDSAQLKTVFYNKNSVDSGLATKAALLHTHDASDITSGIINTARLGTGVANSTKVLAGNGTWVTNTGSDSVYINLTLEDDSLRARRINGDIDIIPVIQTDTNYFRAPLRKIGDTTELNSDSIAVPLKYASRDTTIWDDSTLIDKKYLNDRVASFSGGCDTCLSTITQNADSTQLIYLRANGDTAKVVDWTGGSSIDTTFLHGRSVSSFEKNATKDSSILTLNDGSRYAVKDSVGAGGGATDSSAIHVGYITIAGDTAMVFSDLKGNSDTIALSLLTPWIRNGNKIYYNEGNVGIGVDTPAYNLHIVQPDVTKGDNSGIYLQNTNTSSGAKISPPLILGAVNNNSSVLTYRDFIIQAETPGSASQAALKIYPRTNYGTYTSPIFQLFENGALTLPGIITQTAGGTNSFNAAITSAGNIISSNGSANSQTRYGFRNTGSANTISGTFYGFSQESTLTTGYGAILVPFRNLYGTNLFNQSGGSTGFGVDSVNLSAKVEIKDTTRGFLLPRMTKAQRDKIISSITGSITNVGSGYTTTSGSPVALTGGSGSGAYGIFVVSGGVVTSLTITVVGTGYQVGDVLSFTGSGTGFQYTISAIGAPAEGLQMYQTDNDPGPRYYIGGTWYKTSLTAD